VAVGCGGWTEGQRLRRERCLERLGVVVAGWSTEVVSRPAPPRVLASGERAV
jgi:hypothetical protein